MQGDIFHITNRGVEKRKVFFNEKDYLRFVHNLQDFNSISISNSYFHRRNPNYGPPRSVVEKLVDVLCWCLLPNHPHIMVAEKIDGGVSKFSMKNFNGYTKYFNKQNDRSGVLFQGKSKIILVDNENYFWHLPFYIHTNPLDLYQRNWREKGVKNTKEAMKFLENYKWSSYPDIIGRENFGEVINKELFYKLFDTGPKKHKKDLENWLKDYPGKMEEFEF